MSNRRASKIAHPKNFVRVEINLPSTEGALELCLPSGYVKVSVAPQQLFRFISNKLFRFRKGILYNLRHQNTFSMPSINAVFHDMDNVSFLGLENLNLCNLTTNNYPLLLVLKEKLRNGNLINVHVRAVKYTSKMLFFLPRYSFD